MITLADGVEVANESDFGTSFTFQSGALDPFKGHTLHVVVAAWDDTTGSKGWSFDVTKEIGPCQEPTPVPPTPVPPTPVPPTPVPPTPAPPATSLTIKNVDGGPEGFSGDFKFSIDCGEAGTFTKTISFPDPGIVTIDDIDAGAVCKVTETGEPDPPAGFVFGDPTYSDNPATINRLAWSGSMVVNHLNQIPPPRPAASRSPRSSTTRRRASRAASMSTSPAPTAGHSIARSPSRIRAS